MISRIRPYSRLLNGAIMSVNDRKIAAVVGSLVADAAGKMKIFCLVSPQVKI